MRTIHKDIWQLALPMIISNISVPLLGLVDTAILGHLQNAQHLGAVAVGASVLSFIYWGFSFLRAGTTGLTAQAFGKDNKRHTTLILFRSLLLGLGLAMIILASHHPLIEIALWLIEPSADVFPHAQRYSFIRVFSAPAVLVTYAVVGWFIGQQNTRIPLIIVVSTNALNIVLDCVFILGLGLKSEGAALATLIAEYAGCMVAFFFIWQQTTNVDTKGLVGELLNTEALSSLLTVNSHLFIRTMCLLISFAFFTSQGAQQGDIILAANSILIQLLLLSAFGMDGFAHAVEALAGKAIGADNSKYFYEAVAASGVWSLLTAVLFAFSFAVFQVVLPTLFTDIPEVIAELRIYMPWLMILPFLTVGSYWLDGVFIGATQTRAMCNTMLFSCFLIYVPVWYITRAWGNHGLWLAFSAFSLSRSISLGLLFIHYSRQKRWFS